MRHPTITQWTKQQQPSNFFLQIQQRFFLKGKRAKQQFSRKINTERTIHLHKKHSSSCSQTTAHNKPQQLLADTAEPALPPKTFTSFRSNIFLGSIKLQISKSRIDWVCLILRFKGDGGD